MITFPLQQNTPTSIHIQSFVWPDFNIDKESFGISKAIGEFFYALEFS